MFGWQSRLDRDAVAAAQRRLAAIAASFDPSHANRDDLFERLDDEPSGAGLDGVEVDGRASPLPDGSTAADTTGGRSRLADDAVGRRAGSPALPRHRIRSRGQLGLAVSPHQVALVALAVVVMVALAAWWVLRSVPHAQPVQLSTQRTLPSSAPAATTPTSPGAITSAPTPAGASPGPAPGPAAATGSVVVDVAGRVRRPGIVQLPAGARVVDALRAAGGARPGVQTRSLNLARPLVDGEQIVVGLRVPAMPGSPGGVTPATGSSIAPVNLNTATAEQLDTLPGIGPVTAQAILTWRTENGSFTSVDELLEVSGIGDATLADIAPYVYV